jgi:hypothetical protein
MTRAALAVPSAQAFVSSFRNGVSIRCWRGGVVEANLPDEAPVLGITREKVRPMIDNSLTAVARAAIGGVVGIVGGVVITLAAVVVRARFQHEYLESVDNLIHWQSAPMILAPAAGVMFGLAGANALKGSIVGSVAGAAVGAVLGAWLGWVFAEYQEGPWAGGLIGAGVCLAAGGLFLGLRAWRRDADAELEFPSVPWSPSRGGPR